MRGCNPTITIVQAANTQIEAMDQILTKKVQMPKHMWDKLITIWEERHFYETAVWSKLFTLQTSKDAEGIGRTITEAEYAIYWRLFTVFVARTRDPLEDFNDSRHHYTSRWILDPLSPLEDSVQGAKTFIDKQWRFSLLLEAVPEANKQSRQSQNRSSTARTASPVSTSTNTPQENPIPYSNTPKSDFRLDFDNFPFVIIEVDSSVGQRDERRLQIQGLCLAKIAYTVALKSELDKANPSTPPGPDASDEEKQEWIHLFDEASKAAAQKSPVIVGLYLAGSGEIRKYMFHYDGDKHYISKEVYCKLDTKGLVEVIFLLFNYAHFRSNTSSLDWFKKPWSRLSQLPGFKKSQKPDGSSNSRKRNSPDDTEHQGSQDGRAVASKQPRKAPGGALVPYQVSLEGKGLYLLPGYGGLPELPYICAARTRDNRLVVIKLTRQREEVQIHRKLSSLRNPSPSPFIIPLLDVICVDDINLLIMPLCTPFQAAIMDGPVSLFMLHLILAVCSLHCEEVAHLDLRPDNLVVNRGPGGPCLWVIDLGLAKHATVGTRLKGFRGVEEWVAPEVRNDGVFNAFAADVWACGNIIRHYSHQLTDEVGKSVLGLTCHFTNEDPEKRPSLTCKQPGSVMAIGWSLLSKFGSEQVDQPPQSDPVPTFSTKAQLSYAPAGFLDCIHLNRVF
ncbi:hypothetical protein VNI00_010056 [Paramarasmius palmivorus]|uniref:Protein kinase domain-containing protein n=1 Tax=Paramarasmius palmivorus TaxID=297713 RepID=A0AAW0CL40_9AGAR